MTLGQVTLPSNGPDYLAHQYGWVVLTLFIVMAALVVLVGAILYWKNKQDERMANSLDKLTDALNSLGRAVVRQGILLEMVMHHLDLTEPSNPSVDAANTVGQKRNEA